jgi:hypothetical protein
MGPLGGSVGSQTGSQGVILAIGRTLRSSAAGMAKMPSTSYFAADKNRYIGSVSLGFGPDGKRLRRKVSGKTKQEVRNKLKALHAEERRWPFADHLAQAPGNALLPRRQCRMR